MNPDKAREIGSELAQLFGLMPEGISDAVLESAGQIALRLCYPVVLEEIRTPTMDMLNDGWNVWCNGRDDYDLRAAWEAMINAALLATK